MSAGRFYLPCMPAIDRNGDPVEGALLYFYENETTTLKTVYADFDLTVPLSNPVVADSAGQFVSIFAEAGADEDPNLYSVTCFSPAGVMLPKGSFSNVRAGVAVAITGADLATKADVDFGNVDYADVGPMSDFAAQFGVSRFPHELRQTDFDEPAAPVGDVAIQMLVNSDDASTLQRSAFDVRFDVLGGQPNGPIYAASGQTISVQKRDWFDASGSPGGETGEIDGLTIFARQGQDDACAVLTNVQGTGSGFLAGIEGTTSHIDPTTAVINMMVGYQSGVVAGIDGEEAVYGHVALARVGVGGSAFHGTSIDAASWDYAWTHVNQTGVIYAAEGQRPMFWLSADDGLANRKGLFYDLAQDALVVRDKDDTTDLLVVGETGLVEAATLSLTGGEIQSEWTTWTPTIAAASPGVTPPTWSVQRARYLRHGKMMSVQLEFTCTAANTGSGTILITGLPAGLGSVANSGLGAGYLSNSSQAILAVASTNQIFVLVMYASGNYGSVSPIVTGNVFVVNLTYEIA